MKGQANRLTCSVPGLYRRRAAITIAANTDSPEVQWKFDKDVSTVGGQYVHVYEVNHGGGHELPDTEYECGFLAVRSLN